MSFVFFPELKAKRARQPKERLEDAIDAAHILRAQAHRPEGRVYVVYLPSIRKFQAIVNAYELREVNATGLIITTTI